MPNTSSIKELMAQFAPVDRRLKYSFAAYGEVAIGVWADCQGKLAGHASYNKSSVKVKVDYLNSLFYRYEREWAKDAKAPGFIRAFGDACYDSIVSDVHRLRSILANNYRNASIPDYELMSWLHITLVLLEACIKNFDIQTSDARKRFGIDSLIKVTYDKYDMKKPFKAMEFIYNKVWNKAKARRTVCNFKINNDSPECHEAFYKISKTLSDPAWLSDKTIQAQMLYEDFSNGYNEIE